MILLGFGLGLLAGVMIGGFLFARRIYSDQLERPRFYEGSGIVLCHDVSAPPDVLPPSAAVVAPREDPTPPEWVNDRTPQ